MQIRKLTFCALLALSACGKNAHHHTHHHQTQAVYHTADGHWYAQNSAGDWFLLYALTAGQNGTSPAPITYPGPERPPGVWSASKAPSAASLRTSTKSEEEEDGDEEADSSEDDSESDCESGEDSSADSGADSDGGADSGGGDGGGGD